VRLAAVVLASMLRSGNLHAACTEPGKERWAIKSSVPAGALTKTPKHVNLSDLIALTDAEGVGHNDARYGTARIPSPGNAAGLKEGQMIATEGWLNLVALEGNDCEYHIQLSGSPTDGNHCLIVEVAKDDATSIKTDAALRAKAGGVRGFVRTKLLKGKEPSGTGNVMQHQVYVRVVGQLFFDDAHVGDPPRGKKGMHAATLWELHPIISMAFAPIPTK
jgi:hypothetical protein